MAIVAKTYTDYCAAQLSTWTELVSTPTRNWLTYCYVNSDFTVRNLNAGPTTNPHTDCSCESGFEVGFVRRVALHDWTTLTLVENADFSEFPAGGDEPDNTLPRFWDGWTTCGPLMEIKRDDTTYNSAPSSVVFSGGASCPAGTTGIKQSIRIRDVVQTKGIYRLIFYYLSSDDNIYITPQITFYGAAQPTGVTFPMLHITTSSSAWHCYDEYVQFDISDPDIDELELVISIYKADTGTFTFNVDDVDFHYAFDLDRAPSIPSNIYPDLDDEFARTVDRTGYMFVGGGGNKKLRGSFDFNLISQTQMEYLKAAWTFHKGHRFNTRTVWPTLENVTLPEILSFHWPGKFGFGYARMAGDMFSGRVPVEEV